MATMQDLTPTPEKAPVATESAEAVTKKQLVSALLNYSHSAYSWGKTLTLSQLPAVEKPLEYIEATVAKSTTDVLSRAKMTPSDVVASLDSKAFELVEYYEVEQKSVAAKAFAAKKLQELKGDEDAAADAKLAEEIELQQLIADAREVAWERVAGLQTQASDRVDGLLDGAETWVDAVIPAGEEDEKNDEPEPEEAATKVSRVRTLSATASRRFKKRAMAKLAGVTLKLREVRSGEQPIVHLDLVRYSELLDLATVRERVNSVGETLKTTESYAVIKGMVVQASAEAEKIKASAKAKTDELAETAEVRVVKPAKEFYAVATAEYVKHAKTAEEMLAKGKEVLDAKYVDAETYVASVRAALGSAWNEKLLKPTLGFFEFCKVASNNVYATYREGAERKSDTAPDGTPYTVENGLEALVSALRLRLSAEWEERVVPAIESIKAKAGLNAESEAESEEVFVDASE